MGICVTNVSYCNTAATYISLSFKSQVLWMFLQLSEQQCETFWNIIQIDLLPQEFCRFRFKCLLCLLDSNVKSSQSEVAPRWAYHNLCVQNDDSWWSNTAQRHTRCTMDTHWVRTSSTTVQVVHQQGPVKKRQARKKQDHCTWGKSHYIKWGILQTLKNPETA